MKALTLTFQIERETKNTIRYSETSDVPAVGTLYLQKHALAPAPWPEALTVEVKEPTKK